MEQRSMGDKYFSRYANLYCLTLWSSVFLMAMGLKDIGLFVADLRTRSVSVNATAVNAVNITITPTTIVNTTDTTINTNSTINTSGTNNNTTFTTITTGTTINATINTTINTKNKTINTTSGLLRMSDMCPGVDYLRDQTKVTVLEANVQDCKEDSLPDFTSGQGVVHGMCGGSTTYCRVHIEVPHAMFPRVTVHRLAFWCESSQWEACLKVDMGLTTRWCIRCGKHSLQENIFELSTKHVFLTHLNLPPMSITIETIKEYSFLVKCASRHSGYVLFPVRDAYHEESFDTHISGDLKASPGWVIMISFPLFIYETVYCEICTEFIYMEPNTENKHVVRWCSEKDKSPRIFPVSHLYINILLTLYNVCERTQKMLFSFHPKTHQPQKLSNGRFNCSIDHYSSFQHHMYCNLKEECENGQDETEHCPFSSPGCQGLVASRNKCFLYVAIGRRLNWQEQDHMCSKMGSQLASIKTREEQNDFRHLFTTVYSFRVYIGYRAGWTTVPVMYSKFQQWSDDTMIYNLNHFITEHPYSPSRDVFGIILKNMVMYHLTRHDYPNGLVCETQILAESSTAVLSVQFPESSPLLSIFIQTSQVLWACLHGHVTHAFLSCDTSSLCGKTANPQSCVLWDMRGQTKNAKGLKMCLYTIAMFECDDMTTLPYTLVCDFQHDCPDDSDESFCEHPTCHGFFCSNGQCVGYSQQCNGHSDCLDSSDENDCTGHKSGNFFHRESDGKSEIIISLDGTGYFTQQVMKADESCLNTHYRCTEGWLYCLPLCTRCNGFFDCIYGEDEEGCEIVMCTGFYRCRASSVCVHGDHLCDGWGQCPQRDDEWLCDTTCPEGCLCQGLSAVCSSPFPAYLFPHLRHIDATGSGLTLTNFSTNTYLIRLSLSRCSLVEIQDLQTANLQFIDLSNNNLETITMNTFLYMWNLRILMLTNNPLTSLMHTTFSVYYTLREIDLSRTQLDIFNNEQGMHLPLLQCLNLSFSAITTFGPTDFRTTPQLTELDLRGNPVNNYHFHRWSRSNYLKRVLSSDFRFCCAILPLQQTGRKVCSSPQSMLSSCTDLLPTDLYKLFFVLTSVCAVLGNFVSVIAVFFTQKVFGKNITTFLLHFQVAKMCMGINTSTNTFAHEISSGKYILFEKTWINSFTCKAAGFLSLLSSEVSVLIIWFITLDHVITFCCPLTRYTLDQYAAAAVCGGIWSLGIMLSVTPFLPKLSHWGVDDQSGLCRLALFDCYDCHQQFRWFTVIVIFNFILYCVVAAGQGIIYRRTPKYQILLDPNKRSMYTSAQLMVKMVLTDAVCWFSLSLTTLMTIDDVNVPDKTHVALVVFVLPLNSALSPFLYMWSVATQQRQERQEQKILQLLKSRISSSVRHCI